MNEPIKFCRAPTEPAAAGTAPTLAAADVAMLPPAATVFAAILTRALPNTHTGMTAPAAYVSVEPTVRRPRSTGSTTPLTFMSDTDVEVVASRPLTSDMTTTSPGSSVPPELLTTSATTWTAGASVLGRPKAFAGLAI